MATGKETLEKILATLADSTKCSPRLTEEVVKILLLPLQDINSDSTDIITNKKPTASKSSKAKPIAVSISAIKNISTKLAPVAMRMVNQNLQCISGHIKSIQSITSSVLPLSYHNKDQSLLCWVDTAFHAISALQIMEPYLLIKSLDVDKALSNLITKLIELGMYERALQELLNLHNRLTRATQISISRISENKQNQSAKSKSSVLKMKTIVKETIMASTSKTEYMRQPKATSIKNETSISINTSGSLENEVDTMYKELLLFPFSENVKDISLVTLILVCQMNSLKCLVEGDCSGYINFLPTWFNMEGNPCYWCKQLMTIDNNLGSKQIDILFRILNKAAATIKTDCHSSILALELRKIGLMCLLETRPSDVAMICGQALRIGSSFCKWLADEKFYASVRAFYLDIMQKAEPVLLDLKDFKCFIDLCGQFVYTAWKANDYKSAADASDLAKRLFEKISFISKRPSMEIVLQIAAMKISLVSFALERATAEGKDSDCEKRLQDAMHSLNGIMVFTEQLTPELLTMMSKFLISIDTLRRAIAALWENATQSGLASSNNRTKDENDEGFHWIRLSRMAADVLDCGTNSVETLWVNSLPLFESLGQKTIIDLNRVSLIIVDSLSLLSQIFFNVEDFKNYEKALSLLNRAENFCRNLKSIDGLRWVSRAFYNIGGIIYNTNKFELALEPMSKTCELLSYYIDSNSKAAGYSIEESVVLYNQLSKRLEVLGVCQQRVGKLEDARKSMERAISVLSSESILLFTNACNIKNVVTAVQEHPLLPKILDRYLKLVLLELPLTEPVLPHDFAHISRLDVTDFGVIMEYELRVIKVLGNKVDLSGIQMEMINRLLELYEFERHPIRRARILLEKVKLVRSTSSYIDKDSAFFSSLAEKAVESLKAEECGDDVSLAELRRYYLAMAYSWAGISKFEAGGLASKSFKMALQLWKLVVGKIPQYSSRSLSAPDIVEQTLARIDDVEKFYGHLQLLADFFCVMDQPINQILSLRLMLRLNNGLRSSMEDSQTDSVYIYTSIGQVYLNLGYTGKAGVAFLQGKAIIENISCTDEIKLQWMLGYSQYLCAIGNSEKSERVFGDAKRIAESRFRIDVKTPISKFQNRTQSNLLLADASYTCSEMSWRLGSLDKAITDALGSLRLLNRVVSSFNRRTKEKSEKSEMINPFIEENTDDGLFWNEKNCRFSTTVIDFDFQLQQGDVIKRFVDCYRLLGNLYVIQGSAREAEYFFRQGLQLATIVRSAALSSKFLLSLTELEYRRYRLDESERNMQKALDIQEQVDVSAKDQAYVKKHIGDLNFRLAAYDPALESYQMAEMILSEITEENYIAGLERIDIGSDNTPREKQMVCLVPQTPISRTTKDGVEFESCLLDSMKSEVLCRAGLVMGKQGNITGSKRLLESNLAIGESTLDAAEYYLTSAKVELLAIKEKLALNSTFGMLSESVICLPAFKPVSGDKMPKKSKKARKDSKPMQQAIDSVLENLTEAYTLSFNISTPHIFNETCLYLAYANMIATYCMDHDREDNRLSAMKCAHYLEMSKGLSLRREMLGSLTQKLCSKSKANADIRWPAGPREEPIRLQSEIECDSDSEMEMEEAWRDNHLRKLRELYSEEGSLDAAMFQEQFVDILPSKWTVCSLTVDIENDVMYIVRLRCSLPPLVLRLPLKRHSLRSGEEDGFGYQDAVAELDDILRLSNESTAVGKLYESKEEKIGWWKNRKGLDVRMKELLDLIDSNWLSGFKGAIVEDYKVNINAFHTFSSNIESLIFKAANPKNKRRATPMAIDAEITKIFLSLGSSPKDEDIEDIIYFLLDAYQFNGLEIALDEINFDELILRFKDALKDYHVATIQNDRESSGSKQHIVLILDKSVQMLPWESLPILRGRTVSRLPCLSFLRDRILQVRHTIKRSNCKENASWVDHVVQRQKAYYILNPSKDLKNTQAEFEDYLGRLDGWDGIIGRPPLEREFETALKNSDLFIYFGHSGGEQYIRGHQIRQFDRCAVTLLMGCSSGALKPAGEFDPYGNALNYIMAGCPTLVANLWDVTDKDIDRFSKALFRNWGLEHDRKADTTPHSLIEAVAKSRDECHLKYLIGSAPVVYGIPCYWE